MKVWYLESDSREKLRGWREQLDRLGSLHTELQYGGERALLVSRWADEMPVLTLPDDIQSWIFEVE